MSGQPSGHKKGAETGCPLQECKNTELIVWKVRNMGICERGSEQNCPITRVSVKRTTTAILITVFFFIFFILFQHKIIELKTKEYKELAEHVKTEMEKLV